MEFKSVSAKMPIDEVSRFKAFCERKGISPAGLIRELILREMESPIPSTVAGKNKIHYNRETDSFTWAIERDTGEEIDVVKSVSSDFLEDLVSTLVVALDERIAFIGKSKDGSVAVPGIILRGGK
ncbi:hypothetical protein ACSAZK_09460 [Methanosarcina sp. Mfa9]|uniref:hypothetical protein n=1 Tax=Methanosarcina sp. Mfa9 TaxID=3439063 RepID=UPI003F87DE44